jgi:hypothetical protein
MKEIVIIVANFIKEQVSTFAAISVSVNGGLNIGFLKMARGLRTGRAERLREINMLQFINQNN